MNSQQNKEWAHGYRAGRFRTDHRGSWCASPATAKRWNWLPRPSSASRPAATCSSRRSRPRARSCTGSTRGSGNFREIVLNDDQVRDFQKYLIYNHSAGIGDPAPVEYVRGAMAGRINVHAHGHSGCRPEITQTLVEMLNKGVTPFVCQKGSVGACGDLAPMSPDRPAADGRGAGLVPGGTAARGEAPRPRRHPGARAGGPRRPGHDQRLQPADRHERAATCTTWTAG